MKRIILPHSSIFGMDNSRQIVLDRFVSLSRNISNHVVKCIVYKDSYSCLDHWVHEIAAWINAANSTKCKSKLKYSDYADTLFGYFGNDEVDAKNELNWFQLSPDYKNYNDFEISEDLVQKVFLAFQDIMKTAIPILLSKEVLSVQRWVSLLKPILDN